MVMKTVMKLSSTLRMNR